MGNPEICQVDRQTRKPVCQVGQAPRFPKMFLDVRNEASRLYPLHLENWVPGALAKNALSQVGKVNPPGLVDIAQSVANALITQLLVIDEVSEAFDCPTATRDALNGENTGRRAADRLRHSEIICGGHAALQVGVIETNIGVVKRFAVLAAGRIWMRRGH